MQGNRSDRVAGMKVGLLSICYALHRWDQEPINMLVECCLPIRLRDGKQPISPKNLFAEK